MNNIENVLFVVVLYKQLLSESDTYVSILKQLKEKDLSANFFVYDNSPTPQEIKNNEYIKFHYIHDRSNPGVARAYNQGATLAEEKGMDWIVILDQDTLFPAGALESYISAMKNAKFDDGVYAPILVSGRKLLSPCKYIFHRGFHINYDSFLNDFKKNKVNKIAIKNKSFFNSGLLIKVDVLKKIGGYDESLFDYSDHDFFYRLSKKISYINLIDIYLEHSFSSDIETDSEKISKRLNMLKKSSFIMSKKYKSLFPIFWFYLRKIKLALIK